MISYENVENGLFEALPTILARWVLNCSLVYHPDLNSAHRDQYPVKNE